MYTIIEINSLLFYFFVFFLNSNNPHHGTIRRLAAASIELAVQHRKKGFNVEASQHYSFCFASVSYGLLFLLKT